VARRQNPTYYDGDLVRAIKDEALRVIAEHGPAAVSLRSIARTLGVSHNAPSKRFPSKSALFAALAIEGFDLIDRRFAEVSGQIDDNDDPVARTVRSSKAFVEWSATHRGHYLVMWQPDLYDHAPDVIEARQRPQRRWVDLVAEAHTAGLGASVTPAVLTEVLWAVVTGLAAQTVNRMTSTPAKAHTDLVIDAAADLFTSDPSE
jgi:AcrR family transcriptional regulator